MLTVDEAQSLAHNLLAADLPRRWSHTQGVATQARQLARVLGSDAALIEAAAWLHDIGYAPTIRATGFHPLDGARHLRDAHAADELICSLVAHHTGALFEAEERGIPHLTAEFPLPDQQLIEALTYCDLTTDPQGRPVDVETRLTEILTRYPPDDAVHRAILRSTPSLRTATHNVHQRLTTQSK